MIQIVDAVDVTFTRSCFYESVECLSCIHDGYISTEHQVPDVSASEIMKRNIILKRLSGGVRQRANNTWRTWFLPVVVVVSVDETLRCHVTPPVNTVDETLGHHRTVLVETSHHVVVGDASDCDATTSGTVTKRGWFIRVVVSRATTSGCRGTHLMYTWKKDQNSRNFATCTPTTETTFVMIESAVQRNPLHVGELHVNIEFQIPAHWV